MIGIWRNHYSLEYLNDLGKDNLFGWVGIEFTGIGDDYLQARMPVDHRTKQLAGIMHGGASCVLAESVGSVASSLVINLDTHSCVGLSIYTSHIRAVRDGWVLATAKPIHLGRSTHIWSILIQHEQGQTVSDTRLTVAILDKK